MSDSQVLSFHLLSGIINNEGLIVSLHKEAKIIRRSWRAYFKRASKTSNMLKIQLYHNYESLPEDCGIFLKFEEYNGKTISLKRTENSSINKLVGYVELNAECEYVVRARPIHSYDQPCREQKQRTHRRK